MVSSNRSAAALLWVGEERILGYWAGGNMCGIPWVINLEEVTSSTDLWGG